MSSGGWRIWTLNHLKFCRKCQNPLLPSLFPNFATFRRHVITLSGTVIWLWRGTEAKLRATCDTLLKCNLSSECFGYHDICWVTSRRKILIKESVGCLRISVMNIFRWRVRRSYRTELDRSNVSYTYWKPRRVNILACCCEKSGSNFCKYSANSAKCSERVKGNK